MPALFFVDFQMVSGNKNKFNSQRESKKREDSGLAPSKTLLKTFQERAAELAGPALAPLGLELVFVQCLIEGGRPVLRLFIDRLSDAASVLDTTALASGVSLDDCAEA